MSMTKRCLDELNAELEMNEEEFYAGYDAHLDSLAMDNEPEPGRQPIRFNENEIGGAFDGYTVYSDADPGL